ncbi:MAG TPA: sulfite exporter TauE/SafE family protein [Ktedonobacteraceae bacterium]
MAFPQLVLLFFVAMVAGTLNSVAGGGSFFTVPVMIFTGMLPVQANTTSTVALWPGSAASIGAYWRELLQVRLRLIFLLIGTSLIGSILGAILLLHTPQAIFVRLLPYLLLMATLLFSLSGPITKKLHVHVRDFGQEAHISQLAIIGISVTQFIIAIYGGYFGGGIGILMLATLALIGMENIHSMNALKVLLATVINAVASATFIIANAVIWPQAILMIIGAIIGGYGGAYFARKIEQKWIRYFVMAMGLMMSIYFFIHP